MSEEKDSIGFRALYRNVVNEETLETIAKDYGRSIFWVFHKIDRTKKILKKKYKDEVI